jgi:hypothetical protein
MRSLKIAIDPENFLFVYCTYGWLVLNLLAAQYTSLSLLFVALRDSWVFIFLAFLVFRGKRRDIIILVWISLISLWGLAPIVSEDVSMESILIFFYGFRDICFIAIVFYFLEKGSTSVKPSTIYWFVYLVAFLYALELSAQMFGFSDAYRNLFNIQGYYEGKGVSTSLAGGLFGPRPSLPLYSPSLIAVLLCGFILLKEKFLLRWVLFLAGVLTMSKVAVFYLVLRVFKPIYMVVFLVGMLSIPFLVLLLQGVKESYPNSIFSMHSGSVIEHISPHTYIQDDDFTLIPDLLGSSSIAASVIAGVNSSHAPESLVVARLLDFNLVGFFVVFLLFYMVLLLRGERRFILVVFLSLQVLTGLANHPVAFFPLLFFMISKK